MNNAHFDEENSKPINPLSDEQLRERIDFTKMMARQEQQIQHTPHIKELLTPQGTNYLVENINNNTGHSELHSRIEKLEDHYNMHTINQRFDEIATKIDSKRLFKIDLTLKNKRQAYYLAALFILSSIIIGMMSKGKEKISIQEKIVYKEATAPIKYFMTKYVNIRTHASTTAKKITTLAPNSTIEILEEQKEWKKVKYHDYVSNKVIIGWAYGDNLKKIIK